MINWKFYLFLEMKMILFNTFATIGKLEKHLLCRALETNAVTHM